MSERMTYKTEAGARGKRVTNHPNQKHRIEMHERKEDKRMKNMKTETDAKNLINTKNETQAAKARKPKASNNGSGRTYKRGKYWAYEIRRKYWDGSQTRYANRYQGSFKTKTEADKARFVALEDVEKEIEAGKHGDLIAKEKAKMTFEDIGKEYLELHKLSWSKTTNQYMKTNFEKCKDYYNRAWDSITMTEFQDIVNIGTTFYTAKKMKLLLSGMNRCALKYYPMMRDYVRECVIPPEPEVEKLVFKKEERNLLWKVVDHDSTLKNMTDDDRFAAAALLIMIYSGMRPGELQNIDPKDIDIANHRICKGGIKTKRGKTGSIFVIDKIAPLVREWMLANNRFAEVSIETIRKRVNALQDKLGMPHHVLSGSRTTTGTALSALRTSEDDLTTIMRHTNIAITRKYYDKSGDENAIEALSRFDRETTEEN